jgi:hypothetical protein
MFEPKNAKIKPSKDAGYQDDDLHRFIPRVDLNRSWALPLRPGA